MALAIRRTFSSSSPLYDNISVASVSIFHGCSPLPFGFSPSAWFGSVCTACRVCCVAGIVSCSRLRALDAEKAEAMGKHRQFYTAGDLHVTKYADEPGK